MPTITVRDETFQFGPQPDTGWLLYHHHSGKFETLEFIPDTDGHAHFADRYEEGGELGTVEGRTTISLGRVEVIRRNRDHTVTVTWPDDWDIDDFSHLARVRRMTGLELAAWRHLLGLSRPELAGMLGVRDDTLKAWEADRDPIPYRIPDEIRRLDEAHRERVQVILNRNDCAVIDRNPAHGIETPPPKGWMVGAVARALAQNPGVMAEWYNGPGKFTGDPD